MTTHKVLHPRDVIDKLNVSRKGGGGAKIQASIKDCLDTTFHGLEEYTRRAKRDWSTEEITAIETDIMDSLFHGIITIVSDA